MCQVFGNYGAIFELFRPFPYLTVICRFDYDIGIVQRTFHLSSDQHDIETVLSVLCAVFMIQLCL